MRARGRASEQAVVYESAGEQLLKGKAEPVALFSNGMQKEAVAIYPGAVALVNFQDVKPGMKVVRVDGHMPGEVGYPFN